jgi:glutathione S-transferase
MRLVIGTKKYSTWSLRPWMLLKYFQVPFEEYLIPFDMKPGARENTDEVKQRMHAASPNGRVPVLVLDDGTAINESLCICEYVNDHLLQGKAWPSAEKDKYRAKSICLEMATGFIEMRRLLPMSVGSRTAREARPPAAAGPDIDRVVAILDGCLAQSGGSQFLFGAFTIPDAFFLPVLFRFETYRVPSTPRIRAYSSRMMALQPVIEWRRENPSCPEIKGISNIVKSYPQEIADACKI